MNAGVQVPWLSKGQIEAAARHLLAGCFGATTISYPVDTDEIVYEYLYHRDDLCFSDEQDLGVDDDGNDILGMMLARAGKVFVTSRLQSSRGRYRFTVGHEIGHWELHRAHMCALLEQPSLFSGDSADDALVAYRHSVFPNGSSRALERGEYQANRFAIALLVNPSVLRAEIEPRFGPTPVYHRRAPGEFRRPTLHEFGKLVASERRDGLPSLGEVFGVSRLAMAIALEEYGFVSDMEPLL